MSQESKKRPLLILAAVAAVVAVILTAAVGIGIYNAPANRLKRCLDLGNKYLTQQQYAAAILEFEKAIAIDKRCVEAYEGGLAAYLGMEDLAGAQEFCDRALGILEGLDAKRLKDKLAEVTTVRVDIRATDIEADSVFNNEGYGSLQINGVDESVDNAGKTVAPIPPQAALADRSGSLTFPYSSTFRRYYVSGDVITLTYGNPYEAYYPEGNAVGYYNLDGSEAFVPESGETTEEVDGGSITKSVSWNGNPLRDGYALAVKYTNVSHWSGFGGGVHDELQSYIIDRNGTVVYTLPEEFNESISQGGGDYSWGYSMRYSLGWCGEGLFAVFAHSLDGRDFTTECKGYMDTAGNMVIDLSGQGYTNLFPFHAGLAVVGDASGLYGVMDKTGNLVIPCTYESIGSFGKDGLCAVWKDGKWGYIDRENKVVIPFAYDDVYGAADGLAAVVKDGRCGLVDYNNQEVVPLEYDDISTFENGVAYAVKDRVLYVIERAR